MPIKNADWVKTFRRTIDATFVARFWKRVDVGAKTECWNWTGPVALNGYGQVYVGSQGGSRSKQIGAHRVAWDVTHGAIPGGLFVCHHCDNPRCCNPAHLFVESAKGNLHDAMKKGRLPRGFKNRMWGKFGEKHHNAKLTDQKVLEIRQRCSVGEPQAVVGKCYGISQKTVSRIVHKTNWSHI